MGKVSRVRAGSAHFQKCRPLAMNLMLIHRTGAAGQLGLASTPSLCWGARGSW